MRQDRKQALLFTFILFIGCLGIGYAYLTTNLSINGTTDIDSNIWDIHFDNIQVSQGSIQGEQVITAPTIGADDLSVSFHINLKNPGDYYEFTIDAVNSGTLNAMIESFSKKLNDVEVSSLPPYLRYDVTYKYGAAIENNQILVANSRNTYKIRVEYLQIDSASDLPSENESTNLSFEVGYIQADNRAIDVDETVYSSINLRTNTDDPSNPYDETINLYIGQPIPNDAVVFTDYQSAIEHISGYPVFLKHLIRNNKIEESSVGLLWHDRLFYLQGGGSTYNLDTGSYNDDSIYFESNKDTLYYFFSYEDEEADTTNYYSPQKNIYSANNLKIRTGYDTKLSYLIQEDKSIKAIPLYFNGNNCNYNDAKTSLACTQYVNRSAFMAASSKSGSVCLSIVGDLEFLMQQLSTTSQNIEATNLIDLYKNYNEEDTIRKLDNFIFPDEDLFSQFDIKNGVTCFVEEGNDSHYSYCRYPIP